MALGETECAQRPESAGRFRRGQTGRFGGREAGQFAGGDEEGQHVGDRFDGILPSQLQGAVDRHEDRLGPRPLIACVVERVLAGDHRRANFPLGPVVVVPRFENLRETFPLQGKPARADGKMKQRIENGNDLRGGLSGSVVKPTGENQGAVALRMAKPSVMVDLGSASVTRGSTRFLQRGR